MNSLQQIRDRYVRAQVDDIVTAPVEGVGHHPQTQAVLLPLHADKENLAATYARSPLEHQGIETREHLFGDGGNQMLSPTLIDP